MEIWTGVESVRGIRRENTKCRDDGLTTFQSLYSATGVVQVNIPAATGDMGVLANHVASIEPLRPGVVEVIEENGAQAKKWFGKSSEA